MFNDFLSILFPETCVGCNKVLGKEEKIVCVSCSYSLPELNLKTSFNNKLDGRIPLEGIKGYLRFSKKSITQKLLHQLKYDGRKDIGIELGRRLAERFPKQTGDMIIPIPVHRSKEIKRGYNQCALIAKGVSEKLKMPVYTDVLYRKKATLSQTKKKRYDRWISLEGVYVVRNQEKIKGKHVVLVDDVITTGATIERCTTELLNKGAKKVSVMVTAIAV